RRSPAPSAAWVCASPSRPAGATTTTCAGAASKTPRSACRRIECWSMPTKAFGASAPRRVPAPAATTMIATRGTGVMLTRRDYRRVRSGGEDLVQDDRCLLLVRLLGEGEFGDEDLAGLGKHPLLTGRQAAVLIAAPQVAHDLADLDDVAGGQLLEVRLVAAGPVRRLFGEGRAQHFEDALEALLADHVADTDEVDVLGRNLDDQVALGDVELQVLLRLALDHAFLDLDDRRGPAVRINDRLANLKKHAVMALQQRPGYHSRHAPRLSAAGPTRRSTRTPG